MAKVIVLDSETTGLQPPIIACEIAYITLPDTLEGFIDFVTDSEKVLLPTTVLVEKVFSISPEKIFNKRFNPGKPIQPGASKVTGIYDKDVKWKDSIETFKLPEETEIIICHNTIFDFKVINYKYFSGQEKNLAFDVAGICTKELAQAAFAGTEGLANNKLTTLISFFYPEEAEIIVSKAHGALQDCYMVILLLAKIATTMTFLKSWDDMSNLWSAGSKDYEALNKVVKDIEVMPFGKHQGVPIKDLPLSYCKGVLEQNNFDPAVLKAIKKRLGV